MRFLISNDDGVYASGLLALYEALLIIGEVWVVAPNTEQSGCASSLSISTPLYAQKLVSGFVAVSGSPADCVYLGLHELYADIVFDYVITGINAGANLGQDVLYSGTFGAALTAQLFGIPTIATSLVGGTIKGKGQNQWQEYQVAAAEIVKIVSHAPLMSMMKELPYHVLNVNIPAVNCAREIKGGKVTRLGHLPIARPVHSVVDPRGRDAYWLSLRKSELGSSSTLLSDDDLAVPLSQSIPDATAIESKAFTSHMTDIEAVATGYVSISPVRLHHTPEAALMQLATLVL